MKIEPCKISLEGYENREELSRRIQEIAAGLGETRLAPGLVPSGPGEFDYPWLLFYGSSEYHCLNVCKDDVPELTPHEFIERYGKIKLESPWFDVVPYGSTYRSAVKESDIKNHQMTISDERPLSEREQAWLDKQNQQPQPEEVKEFPDINNIEHADFTPRMGWRGKL
jgi:hypothetical protein